MASPVLKLIQCSNLGGMEQVTFRLLRALNGDGYQFRIMTPRPFGAGEQYLKAVDSQTQAFEYRGRFGWRSHGTFLQGVQQRARDASAAWVTGTDVACLRAIRGIHGIPKILSHHFHHFEDRLSPLKWRLFYDGFCRQLDYIAYPTEFTRAEAVRIAPWLKDRTIVVPYGYDVHFDDDEHFEELKRSARSRLGISQDAFVVGNAGWLIHRKRPDVFVTTARLVADRIPHAHFVWCGGGPLENVIKKQVADIGLSDRFTFTGWINDLVPYYQSWDICLFNSDFDTLPCTPTEAATHGCIVVASLVYGGLSEMIENEVNGILLNSHDCQVLADRITALASDESSRKRFRMAASRKLKENFSMKKMIETYGHLLRGN